MDFFDDQPQPPPIEDEFPTPLSPDEAAEVFGALTALDPKDQTDYGNGERLVERYGGNYRYVRAWGKWVAWNGRAWVIDAELEAMRLAGIIADEEEAAVRNTPMRDPAVRRAQLKRAQSAKSHGAISSAVRLSACHPSIALDHDQLDKCVDLLPVANGLVDLRTGELRPHDREQFYTRCSPIVFDPAAECPRWDRFLLEIFDTDKPQDDVDLIKAVQRAVGYSLTGSVAEQCLFFLHGAGRNGKSTFVEIIMALLGDLAAPAPRNFLELKGSEGHETSLTVLFGRRAIVCPETTQGKRWDETLVKQLSGGDKISARRMREDHWSFEPSHKLWVVGNHKPVITGTDDGIWRRIHLIPFNTQVDPMDVDPGLKAALLAELPGILAWAVRGAVEWRRSGLGMPKTVIEASKKYRQEQDVHRQFIEDCCVLEQGAWVSVSAIRGEYVSWCKSNGVQELGARQFCERLRRAGVESALRRNGATVTRGWAGIRIRLGTDDVIEAPATDSAPPF